MRARAFCCCRILASRQYLDALAAGRRRRSRSTRTRSARCVRHANRGGAAARAACRATIAPCCMREMELMPEWFLARHLGLTLAAARARDARPACSRPRRAARAGAAGLTFVHRDYHSRNLLVTEADNPGDPGFPGCRAGSRDLRFGIAAQGLLHRLAAGARAAAGLLAYRERLLEAGFALDAERGAVHALVRPDRTATAHQGARHFRAALFYRDGKPQYLQGLAARARLHARRGAHYPETARISPSSSSTPHRSAASQPRRRARAGVRPGVQWRSDALPASRGDDPGGRTRRAHAAADRRDAEAAAARCTASR